MSTSQNSGISWLLKNNSVLKWRLIGPNIKNPFDSSASDKKLEDYVSDKSMLMEACQVHALMDDTLVLKITDLTLLRFQTEHPNLSSLTNDELGDFLNQSNIMNFINQEFKKLQDACETELEARKG